MESFRIAAVAADAAVPFVAVRVIVDVAADELPGIVTRSRCGRTGAAWRLIARLPLAPAGPAAPVRLARRHGGHRAAGRGLAAPSAFPRVASRARLA